MGNIQLYVDPPLVVHTSVNLLVNMLFEYELLSKLRYKKSIGRNRTEVIFINILDIQKQPLSVNSL